MASTQQQSGQSLGSDSDHHGELCVKVVKTELIAVIEGPFVQQPLVASCQGDGDHPNGELTALELMCKSASKAIHPCTSATPVTPRRIAIPSNAMHARMPLTPDQTPSRGIKRSFSTALAEASPSSKTKKLFGIESEKSSSSSPFRRNSIPKFSILYKHQQCKSPVVSALELKRASEAVLKQVDWEAVEEEVASNRGAAIYRKVIKSILQERIDHLADLESVE